jgi:hypothetical protein
MVQVIRAPEQIHDPLIAYDNAARLATSITASTTDGDNVAANLFNSFTFDAWKPDAGGSQFVQVDFVSPVTVEYFAFYNTDAADNNATLKLQYDAGGYVDAASYTPTDNSPQILTFAPVTSTSFRIVVDCATPCAISVASFGELLRIPFGLEISFLSPHNAQQYKSISNTSETGNFIGRSVQKQSTPFSISSRLLEYDWFVANWRPFIRSAERRPFFFKWSDTTYTDESVYCWTNDAIATPAQTDDHFLSFSLELRGLVS